MSKGAADLRQGLLAAGTACALCATWIKGKSWENDGKTKGKHGKIMENP